LKSAKAVIEDYTTVYGKPVKFETGDNKYLDRKNYDYEKKIGKRELFYEASWATRTMNIKISCDYRSNYFEEFRKIIRMTAGMVFIYFYDCIFSIGRR